MNETTARLAAAVHFVIHETSGQDLGKTKLNKILWFADCDAYRRHGETVTGLASYVKLQYGPVPNGIDLVIRDLIADGSIEQDSHQVGTYIRHGYNSLAAPGDTNCLSERCKQVLQNVIEAVRPLTAFEVSEISHDALWEETPHGGEIPVAAAASQPVTPDQRIMEWAQRETG
ncbi:MAG: Panacea domain-containing protein [Pseudomonadota bacterium]